MALVGANGTGKTTLLSLLAGLIHPHSGQIFIHGSNIYTDAMIAKQSLGFLPDHVSLYPELTVKEYLQLVAKLHQIPKTAQNNAIANVLEDLHLTAYQHYLIGILSKGLKQRIGIAKAMIHQPAVLLLDEPTQGLDPDQIEVFRLLLIEKKKNSAIILSTHCLNEVRSLCDHIMNLNHHYSGIPSHDTYHCSA